MIGIRQGERHDARRIAERHRDHSLFMAFAPAEAPRLALAIIVENGGFGAQAAAPIARKVFDYYLLGVARRPAGGRHERRERRGNGCEAGAAAAQTEGENEQDLRDVPERIGPEPISPTEVNRQ